MDCLDVSLSMEGCITDKLGIAMLGSTICWPCLLRRDQRHRGWQVYKPSGVRGYAGNRILQNIASDD